STAESPDSRCPWCITPARGSARTAERSARSRRSLALATSQAPCEPQASAPLAQGAGDLPLRDGPALRILLPVKTAKILLPVVAGLVLPGLARLLPGQQPVP